MTKGKIDNFDFIKLENVLPPIMKKENTEQKKIFINQSDKGLGSRKYKEPLQLNNTKRQIP